MLLVIGKPAEFDEHRLPMRGQCQPYSKGWQLRMFHRGKTEVLYEDTYYTCRQLQLACLDKSPEDVRKTVNEMHVKFMQDLQETAALAQTDTAEIIIDPETPSLSELKNDNSEEDTVNLRPAGETRTRKIKRKDFEF